MPNMFESLTDVEGRLFKTISTKTMTDKCPSKDQMFVTHNLSVSLLRGQRSSADKLNPETVPSAITLTLKKMGKNKVKFKGINSGYFKLIYDHQKGQYAIIVIFIEAGTWTYISTQIWAGSEHPAVYSWPKRRDYQTECYRLLSLSVIRLKSFTPEECIYRYNYGLKSVNWKKTKRLQGDVFGPWALAGTYNFKEAAHLQPIKMEECKDSLVWEGRVFWDELGWGSDVTSSFVGHK
ncbi:uncharacterized protein EV154DRAFT_555976 [Mucor mucedo]|uniref:uncharacterized protein n=1 Tax=Mucor mucedo TaxID=29922 RepID=UPI002220ECF9|nr:uncharacterized protein EV154DRAFT_555976 [Mucor mucedo]KAI7874600.1 hypothetical protein EV154DRAFT_555976 [Mucor mucedo]